MTRRVPGLALATASAIVLVTGLAGCNLVGRAGEGPVKDETRTTAAFSKIEAGNGIGLSVTIGATPSVVVSAQENILPIIATDIQGDTLRIHSTQGYTTSEAVKVTVVSPGVSGISLSGGSQATADGLAADRLAIELSGGSAVTARGSATTLGLQVSGGSRANLGELATKTVTLDLSGGSTAIVNASDTVTGSASGGARATVLGGGRIDVQVTGGSDVSHG